MLVSNTLKGKLNDSWDEGVIEQRVHLVTGVKRKIEAEHI